MLFVYLHHTNMKTLQPVLCADEGLAISVFESVLKPWNSCFTGPDVKTMLYNFRYLEWSRALQDVNTALSQTKPLVSVLFDKSTWHPEGHELGPLLKSHGACLDLSAGSGSALSHQYDQGQVNELISHCYGALYGTGDIHPPEPPRTPEHETQVRTCDLSRALSRALSRTLSRALSRALSRVL